MPQAEIQTKKKRNRRVAKKYSQDDVAKMMKEAEEKAKKEALEDLERKKVEADFEFENGEVHNEGEGINFLGEPYYENPQEISKEEEEANAFDLFEFMEKAYAKAGTPIKYQIKRDNTLLGEMYHPCSWPKIQKKHGEGHYTVVAKKRTDNTYIKQQTLDLGPPERAEEDEEKRVNDRLLFLQSQQQPQGSQIDQTAVFTQMAQMFQKMQEMQFEDKKGKERDERKSEKDYNSTMLTIMQGQQQSTMQMFMEMQKNNQDMMKTFSENFSRTLEKMDEKNNKMFEKLSDTMNKKEQFGTMDLIKMMKEAEDNGWNKMQLLMELSEAKAADKDDDDTGVIGKLVSGVLPLLTGAQKAQSLALQQAHSGLNQAINPSPKALPPRTSSQPRAVQNAPRASGQARQAPPQRPGIPTFKGPQKRVSPEREVSRAPNPAPVKETPKANQPDDDIFNTATQEQQTIAQIAIPLIADGLMKGESPDKCAAVCLAHTSQVGFGADGLLEHFPFDFMLQVARKFGVGNTQVEMNWFKGFYAYIENTAGMDAQGITEPAESEGIQPSMG